ncbi:VWA domain-containing protein [Streptomyces sp. NPDC051940]|uniref:vWA domain-containing protein n=1 Tax=Streptomyces sp. NPDC051940 TaxID=3155675 RepID=UPI003434D8A0
MRGLHRRTAGAVAGALLALAAGPLPAARAAAPAQDGPPPADSSLVMVLDSSGSMRDDAGGGQTRIQAARDAIGSVVDSLPDGYPTGLRVYGADRESGCTDTRLVKPVTALDRAGLKEAVAAVKPKGDTPIGHSLRQAAKDLPEPAAGTVGHRSILLISDGEDNCGTPPPCEVAEELGKQGVDLRIDTIGFQVRGKARKQLECIAEAGHGSYYDAPDAAALGRQLQRAGQLSADAYRFKGEPVTGGPKAEDAADLAGPGQYLDSIGPGETRWYSAALDAISAADFGATAVPNPGVPVKYGDGIRLRLRATDPYTSQCDAQDDNVQQEEGARVLTNAVSRIPSPDGGQACDKAGRYLFSVERVTSPGADQARWPLELRLGVEAPLKAGVTPAQSETEYADIALPTAAPKDVEGGTGFNDARALTAGVWRDRLLPGQTRYYKIPVGWGQQLRYRAEFANEPKLQEGSGVSSYVDTDLYSEGRGIVGDGPYTSSRSYYGDPVATDLGTVPVSWTNRWESAGTVRAVRHQGDYYLTVRLGPNAARFAQNAAIGVVLRVAVAGEAKAGPQHNAPALAQRSDNKAGKTATAVQGSGDDGGNLPLVAGASGAAVLAAAAVAYILVRKNSRNRGTQ